MDYVDPDMMNAAEVVHTYKQLSQVEKAFCNIKTVALEIRPIYHKTDQRIRSHVFLCMLAYYVLWHIRQALEGLLNKKGKSPQEQRTMEYVFERSKSIRKETVVLKEKEITIVTTPDSEQQEILET